jgi:hypothetical protein
VAETEEDEEEDGGGGVGDGACLEVVNGTLADAARLVRMLRAGKGHPILESSTPPLAFRLSQNSRSSE